MHSITALGTQGIKSNRGESSAFLLNAHHTIDAGNIVNPLGEYSADIHHVWLTHSHLDHIADLAYMLDSYYTLRTKTLTIHALPDTIQVLKEHFFNYKVWPDFANIALSNNEGMTITYAPITPYVAYPIGEDSTILAFETDHTVTSCGYIVTKGDTSLLISSDTYSVASVISMVQQHEHINALVIECSFSSEMHALAKLSKHLTPKLLFDGLREIEDKGLKLYINHMKPTYHTQIIKEIEAMSGSWDVTILNDGDTIQF